MNLLLKQDTSEEKATFRVSNHTEEWVQPIYAHKDSVDVERIDQESTGTGEWISDHDPLHRIEMAIRGSRSILDLASDWDDAGASTCSESTWKRATTFLRDHANWAYRHQGVIIPPPAILPGPDGSIDLHWRTTTYELLVNVPGTTGRPASFYGDDYRSLSIKGTINPELPNRGLIAWLTDRVSEEMVVPSENDGQARQV